MPALWRSAEGNTERRAALRQAAEGTVPDGSQGNPTENPAAGAVLTLLRARRRASAPLAQLAEQLTLNQRVRGSSPWRRTIQPQVRLLLTCGFCVSWIVWSIFFLSTVDVVAPELRPR